MTLLGATPKDVLGADPSRLAMSAPELAASLRSDAWWRTYDPDCAKSRAVGFGPATERPSRERYAGLQGYRQCLDGVKSLYATSRANDLAALMQADAVTLAELARTDAALAAAKAEAEFMGMRFGLGAGVSWSRTEIVSDAELGPGNVGKATKRERQLPRVILESHYYGWCRAATCNAGTFGAGPYFGIVAKTDRLISAFATGVMFGWKDRAPSDRQGFSVGIGAVLDAAVNSLAPGFEDGKPLPDGETSIRFEEKSRWSAIVFITRTF